jgi:hypothetical protein
VLAFHAIKRFSVKLESIVVSYTSKKYSLSVLKRGDWAVSLTDLTPLIVYAQDLRSNISVVIK